MDEAIDVALSYGMEKKGCIAVLDYKRYFINFSILEISNGVFKIEIIFI